MKKREVAGADGHRRVEGHFAAIDRIQHRHGDPEL
jgi:hypothetical protein